MYIRHACLPFKLRRYICLTLNTLYIFKTMVLFAYAQRQPEEETRFIATLTRYWDIREVSQLTQLCVRAKRAKREKRKKRRKWLAIYLGVAMLYEVLSQLLTLSEREREREREKCTYANLLQFACLMICRERQ